MRSVSPMRLVRSAAGLLPALALLAACNPASGAHTPAGVTTPTPRVTAPAKIGPVGPIGPLDPAHTLDLSFVLRARGDLGQRAAAVGDPLSPGYRQYLTPAQIAQQYGPDPADVARTAAVLRANGLDVTAPVPDGVLLGAHGTVGQIERLLGIHLIQYRGANGELSFAPDGVPLLPAAFGGAVTGVLGLDRRTYIRTGVSLAPSAPRQALGVAGFTPASLESAYDVGPLHQAGRDGSGQTIALAEIDTFNSADVQSYDQVFGISAPPVQVIKVDGGATATSPEPVLDIEVVRAIAPHATVLVYESPEDLLSVARMLSQILTLRTG